MTKFAARRRGFTLIELLIVIVVIAILALIVIPRVMSAGRKARESTLRANLHQLRNALEQFQADTGLYPSELIDLTAAKSDPPVTGVNEDGDTETIPSGSYQGPYLSVSGGIGTTGIPVNPFKHPSDADYTDETAHWSYGVEGPGIVHPAVPTEGNTLDGLPYSSL
jgi:general secretion pathway protein G